MILNINRLHQWCFSLPIPFFINLIVIRLLISCRTTTKVVFPFSFLPLYSSSTIDLRRWFLNLYNFFMHIIQLLKHFRNYSGIFFLFAMELSIRTREENTLDKFKECDILSELLITSNKYEEFLNQIDLGISWWKYVGIFFKLIT